MELAAPLKEARIFSPQAYLAKVGPATLTLDRVVHANDDRAAYGEPRHQHSKQNLRHRQRRPAVTIELCMLAGEVVGLPAARRAKR